MDNSKLQKANLLFVEDEIQIRSFAADALEIVVENIDLAENGQIGLDLFLESLEDGKRKYDLIVSDLKMPIMDGFTMIEEIRIHDTNIPILILTADNDRSIEAQKKKLGVNGHLQKPTTMLKLVEMMNDLL